MLQYACPHKVVENNKMVASIGWRYPNKDYNREEHKIRVFSYEQSLENKKVVEVKKEDKVPLESTLEKVTCTNRCWLPPFT